ncbi:UDP-N-acetylmuramate--L-alanine ligase [cyanobiont of Ornithocercus magnificus]|nr:UDP-N-acetylmuramate--L-alanine ligase [cyanobiont of Ornithocercus magnificus]
MSALALILAHRGYRVTGSDLRESQALRHLQSLGVRIFHHQGAATIELICQDVNEPPLLVVSTAIPDTNPELQAARERNLPIWHRSDILASLIASQPSIVVAGSHGKTTTSTLITTLLAAAGEDPVAVVGGVIPYYKSNGHAGEGRLLVAEADESDGTLVKFRAELAVVMNLELDHTDHYSHLGILIRTMQQFTGGCRTLLANYDDLILRHHLQASAWWSTCTSFGVDYACLPAKLDGNCTVAEVFEQGLSCGHIIVPLPGLHNLSNVTAAIAACRLVGLPMERILSGLSQLQSPKRRFDFRGIWQGRLIVDDYAHHPSEVRATLSMARMMVRSGRSPLPISPGRLLVVFQPHRYSRTSRFLTDFADAFTEADILLLAPVYSAGEIPVEGASSERLGAVVKERYPKLPVVVAEDLSQLVTLVQEYSVHGDLVLAMGAGDVNSLWARLMSLEETEKCPPLLVA